MKTILFLTDNIPHPQMGGIERVTSIIGGELIKRGYRCFCCYFSNPYHLASLLPGIELTYTVEGIERLKRYIQENDIDIFINQHLRSSFIQLLIEQAVVPYSIKRIYVSHNMPGSENKSLYFDKKFSFKAFVKRCAGPLYMHYLHKKHIGFQRYNFNISDRYILLSSRYKADLLSYYHLEDVENKILTISNPLSFEYKFPEEEVQKKENIVLVVSRLEEGSKRISYVLQIWKWLLEQGVNNWKLVIVGHGRDEEMYKKMAEVFRLKNITFEGRQDPFRYYQSASVFMMTSAVEGWPMTLTEVLQMGVVPVVMDSFKSLHDIIISGENGIIVQDRNIEAFGVAVMKLMKEAELRKKIAIAGIRSSKRFSKEVIVAQWVSLFENL